MTQLLLADDIVVLCESEEIYSQLIIQLPMDVIPLKLLTTICIMNLI